MDYVSDRMWERLSLAVRWVVSSVSEQGYVPPAP